MTELVKVILIALACPFVLPLVIGEEKEKMIIFIIKVILIVLFYSYLLWLIIYDR